MTVLVLGLIIFLGVHSLRIFAEGWRTNQIARLGELPYKGMYAIASLTGFLLIVWGYGMARETPLVLWTPPSWTRHVAALFVLAAFVQMAAAYVPRNRIKGTLGHPMILGVKAWAFGHLVANGTLADLLLFGGFLVWAVFDYRAARLRDRASGRQRAHGTLAGDAGTVAIGLIAWVAFAFYLHVWLIGVPPLG